MNYLAIGKDFKSMEISNIIETLTDYSETYFVSAKGEGTNYEGGEEFGEFYCCVCGKAEPDCHFSELDLPDILYQFVICSEECNEVFREFINTNPKFIFMLMFYIAYFPESDFPDNDTQEDDFMFSEN